MPLTDANVDLGAEGCSYDDLNAVYEEDKLVKQQPWMDQTAGSLADGVVASYVWRMWQRHWGTDLVYFIWDNPFLGYVLAYDARRYGLASRMGYGSLPSRKVVA